MVVEEGVDEEEEEGLLTSGGMQNAMRTRTLSIIHGIMIFMK